MKEVHDEIKHAKIALIAGVDAVIVLGDDDLIDNLRELKLCITSGQEAMMSLERANEGISGGLFLDKDFVTVDLPGDVYDLIAYAKAKFSEAESILKSSVQNLPHHAVYQRFINKAYLDVTRSIDWLAKGVEGIVRPEEKLSEEDSQPMIPKFEQPDAPIAPEPPAVPTPEISAVTPELPTGVLPTQESPVVGPDSAPTPPTEPIGEASSPAIAPGTSPEIAPAPESPVATEAPKTKPGKGNQSKA